MFCIIFVACQICHTTIQSANDLAPSSSTTTTTTTTTTTSSSSTTSESFYSVYDSEDNSQWPDIDHEQYTDIHEPHPFDGVFDAPTRVPVAVCINFYVCK